ncbi:MAG: PAS domain-containing sensor histidine kinase [Dactylosporangium sp.]|nr:PAS domain-containing sensor histidine kinase [Dactylosporangium sp.]NNJ62367.1 PAS domain-containing sensor histidine kinase [Dactylosporangium sp.]
MQSLVARLAALRGVSAASITVTAAPGDDPFAALAAALPADVPAAVVRSIGPEAWRLQLRVAFRDPGRYARFGAVIDEIAAATDRAMARPRNLLDRPPGPQPSAMYAAICGRAPEVIVLVDPREGWIPLSDSFSALLGYDGRVLPQGGPLGLLHPADLAAAVSTFVTSCAGRHPADPVDLRVRAADGRWLTFEVVARSFAVDHGAVIIAYFGVDVTAQRQAVRLAGVERGRLATLVEMLPDGVLILDGTGRIAVANEAARQSLRLGGGRDGQRGVHDAASLVAALQPALVEPRDCAGKLRDVLDGAHAVAGCEIEFADGRILELDAVPLSCDGDRIGRLVQSRDVTARVAAIRGLEHGIWDPEAPERVLAESMALNNEFASTVAHELRGPLASVVAFSCLLGEAGSGPLTDEQRGHLAVIDRNANRLLRLIEDLLLLSRLEARTLHLQRSRVRMMDLLGAAVTEYEPGAVAAGIDLRRDLAEGPDPMADGARLYQVMANLLENALHFTPRGGRITVRARPDRDRWTIEVADTGVGIPATDLPRLFSVFFRGSNVTAAVGRQASPGTGLGLVVCRAIVELHHGAIQVASTEGIGTTVTLTLPVGPEPTSEVDRESAARR